MKIQYCSKELIKLASDEELKRWGDGFCKAAFEKLVMVVAEGISNGISGVDARRIGRIMNAVDDDNSGYINISDEDGLYLYNLLNNDKLSIPVRFSRIYTQINCLVNKSYMESVKNG